MYLRGSLLVPDRNDAGQRPDIPGRRGELLCEPRGARVTTRERTVRIAGRAEPRSSERRGPLTGVLSPLASLKPSTELLSKPEQSHEQLPNLRSRKPSSISEVPASDVPGRRGRAEVPVLWGTPSFIGKSTEAITEIRL
jgi:hypothetical protein